MARALFFLIIFVPITLLYSIASIIGSLFDRSGRAPHLCAISWSRIALRLAGVKLVVEGQEKVPQGQPVIFMGNHQSNFDIPALFVATPSRFAWIAKEELFRIPVFGQALRRAGYIPLDRSDGRRARKSLDNAAVRIRNGASVVIFPEGTRSKDGKLLPFKKGGFLLAAKAGVPVVPFVINGSHRINPPPTLVLRPGVITIRFFEQIPGEHQPDALSDHLRTLISSNLDVI